MSYIKVKDKNYLYRDEYSMGIVNTDHEGYQQYVADYTNKYNQIKKVQKMEEEIQLIRNDLDEIKNLLRNLANGS